MLFPFFNKFLCDHHCVKYLNISEQNLKRLSFLPTEKSSQKVVKDKNTKQESEKVTQTLLGQRHMKKRNTTLYGGQSYKRNSVLKKRLN